MGMSLKMNCKKHILKIEGEILKFFFEFSTNIKMLHYSKNTKGMVCYLIF